MVAIAQPPEEIQLAELQSLDTLIDTIAQPNLASFPVASPIDPVKPAIKPENTVVKLCQWLEGIFNESWQSPSLVLASNLRSSTRLGLNTQTLSFNKWQSAYRQIEAVRSCIAPKPGIRLTPKGVTIHSESSGKVSRCRDWQDIYCIYGCSVFIQVSHSPFQVMGQLLGTFFSGLGTIIRHI